MVWYTSAEKLEPRLGLAAEGLSPYERPLATARDAMRLAKILQTEKNDTPIAKVLLAHPELRDAVRRLQVLERHPYAEICDNTIDEKLFSVRFVAVQVVVFLARLVLTRARIGGYGFVCIRVRPSPMKQALCADKTIGFIRPLEPRLNLCVGLSPRRRQPVAERS